MKMMIIGASGLVGSALVDEALRRGLTVTAVCRSDQRDWPETVQALTVDLSKPPELDRLLLDHFPDLIINATSLARHDDSPEAQPDPQILVTLPHRLAQLTNHLNGRLIHFSSDQVFDGRDAPYRSTDLPNPRSPQGQLNLLAERRVLEAGGDSVTVMRIPLVLGNSRSGQRSPHEQWFARWAEGQRVALSPQRLLQPISAPALAEAMIELALRPQLHGLFHWAGREALSAFAIGTGILEHFGLPTDLVEATSGDQPLDFRLELRPLLGKLVATPPDFREQLNALNVPERYQAWLTSLQGTSGKSATTLPRLVKGRDF